MCQAGLTEFTLGVKFTNFQTQPLTQRCGSNYPYQAALPGAPGRFRLLDCGKHNPARTAHGSESIRCRPDPSAGVLGCLCLYRLVFACSMCSGVPQKCKSLILNGFVWCFSWNTDSVPACSKVFHFRLLQQNAERTAKPRQLWSAANSGGSTPEPAAGIASCAPTREAH